MFGPCRIRPRILAPNVGHERSNKRESSVSPAEEVSDPPGTQLASTSVSSLFISYFSIPGRLYQEPVSSLSVLATEKGDPRRIRPPHIDAQREARGKGSLLEVCAHHRIKKVLLTPSGCQSERCVTTMDLDHTPPVMMPAQPPAPKERRVRQQAKTTQEASVPTWGQLKKLTTDAQQVVKEQGVQVTPSNLYLAMMALVSCQERENHKENQRSRKSLRYGDTGRDTSPRACGRTEPERKGRLTAWLAFSGGKEIKAPDCAEPQLRLH
ncbi:hypothetical protein QTO34_003100 [Cnephaeus nilssonii]|uniref:Uncharacterized protein n=1 Tax=Cnephaeus nilssonii TaxID=3371016 RepID=A0AA40HQ55_CNENI|nr:hypothetical protein QTO34_003100 [Eptesicus nilssonii]